MVVARTKETRKNNIRLTYIYQRTTMAFMPNDIDPHCWGESGWTMFHAPALSAPVNLSELPDEQTRLRDFYTHYGKGLPCTSCRGHYADGIQAMPPPVDDRTALIEWTIEVHNRVNVATGKARMDPDEALLHWSQRFGRNFQVVGHLDVEPRKWMPLVCALGVLVVLATFRSPRR